jgi:hypothetical protein
MTIFLYFEIPFEKGVVGEENKYYFNNLRPCCNCCGIKISLKSVYWYWAYDETSRAQTDYAFPVIDDDDYFLCEKCVEIRRKVVQR